jgi:putative FmdB family regulatory protein
MPTYEYRCLSCGFDFEEFQSIAAEPVTVCPRCAGHVRRVISGGVGLIFKGSGFYETDYKRRGITGNSPGKKEEKVIDTTGDKDSKSES